LNDSTEPCHGWFCFAPLALRDSPIQARLVGCVDKLAIDARDRLVFGNDQPREILGEVLALRLVGKQISKMFDRICNDVRKLDNREDG